MAGYFLVSEYPNRDKHPFDIAFQLSREAKGKIPAEQSGLKSEVERTLDVVRTMFAPEDIKFHRYFDELLALSRYGLVGETAQPAQALDTLRNLQKRIFDQEKGKAVSVHMRAIMLSQLLLLSGVAAVAAAAVGAVWYLNGAAVVDLLPLFVVIPGLFLGVVFSSFLRCRAVEFYDLSAIDADRFTPFMKSAFALLTLALAAVFLKAELIEIAIGKVSLRQRRIFCFCFWRCSWGGTRGRYRKNRVDQTACGP